MGVTGPYDWFSSNRGAAGALTKGRHIYPVLFRIGSFEITSFGALVAIAALVALQTFKHELKRSGLPAKTVDAGFAGVFGGLLGAKVWWILEFSRTAPLPSLLLSRGGMSWFGGLSGGLLAGLALIRARGLPVLSILAAAAPALAVGHAIGRVGCFLVGDDYGRPSNLPWAVAFPEGLPPTTVRVHPTQLYESLALLAVAAVLMTLRRRRNDDRVVFGVYLVLAGATRFLIEFLRVNQRVAGPLTIAHIVAAAVALIGAWLLASSDRTFRPVSSSTLDSASAQEIQSDR